MRGGVLLQIDPRRKAAECDRAIERVADPERRIVLERLRSLWIAVHDAASDLDESDHADQLSAIAQIHTELMTLAKDAMH